MGGESRFLSAALKASAFFSFGIFWLYALLNYAGNAFDGTLTGNNPFWYLPLSVIVPNFLLGIGFLAAASLLFAFRRYKLMLVSLGGYSTMVYYYFFTYSSPLWTAYDNWGCHSTATVSHVQIAVFHTLPTMVCPTSSLFERGPFDAFLAFSLGLAFAFSYFTLSGGIRMAGIRTILVGSLSLLAYTVGLAIHDPLEMSAHVTNFQAQIGIPNSITNWNLLAICAVLSIFCTLPILKSFPFFQKITRQQVS